MQRRLKENINDCSLSFSLFSCDTFFQSKPWAVLIINCLFLQKKTWKNFVFPLGLIKKKHFCWIRMKLWHKQGSGHDLGHAPCRHGPGLVRPLLLCTYKALAVADLHYDSYENKQRLLAVQRAVWGHSSRWAPQDRKGWKTFKICGLFQGLCWEGGHSAPYPMVSACVVLCGWSCCQETKWTCYELPPTAARGRRDNSQRLQHP